MDELEHLEQEHREVERMIAQLKESAEGEGRTKILEELRSSLSTHMAVEERFIYPLVEKVADEEEREGGENEHDLIRDSLRTLFEMKDEPGFNAALDMFEAGLSHHVEDEESEMFPELREKVADKIAEMDPDELEAAVKQDDDGPGGSAPTREELYEKAKEQDVAGRSTMTKDELAEAVEGG